MGRYLIVANQTLGGEKLDQAVKERIDRGDSEFYIVVPRTLPKHEMTGYAGGFPVGGGGGGTMTAAQAYQLMEGDTRRRQAMLDEARGRAERRLGQMIDRIRSAGGDADGKVGAADPVVAVKAVLDNESFDEVIISTLPRGLSRWLRKDLPRRVSRMTTAPVTTIEAEE